MAITEAYAGSETVGVGEWSLTADARRRPGPIGSALLAEVIGAVNSYTTTVTPTYTAGRAVIVDVANAVVGGTANTPTVTGGSLTWSNIGSVAYGPTGAGTDVRLTRFRSMGSGSGALVVDFGGQTQSGGTVTVYEIPNVDTSGTFGSGAFAQTQTATSGATAVTVIEAVLATIPDTSAALFAVVVNYAATAVTPRPGWNELSEPTTGQDFQEHYGFDNAAGGTFSSTQAGCIVSELIPAAKRSIATAGCYVVFLDLNALAAGDAFEARVYEKTGSGSAQCLVEKFYFAGVQGVPNWASPPFVMLNGWDMTLVKLAGTDRNIDWSIRKVA